MKEPQFIPRHESHENTEKDITGLVDSLSEITGENLDVEHFGGTYEIDSDLLRLSFTISEDVFEIRNIEVLVPGIGSKVIGSIHEYALENDLKMVASNVKDGAEGFWQRMGYSEGTEPGEFIKD